MSEPFDRECGCRCGQVRFRVTAPPMMTMACHCRGCQKMTASAFSLSALVSRSAFDVIEGETVVGGLHAQPEHHFCAWCMSWVFSHPPIEDFINFRSTLLDDPSGLDPFMETMTAEKLSWAATPAEHAFEGFPPPEAFGPLIAAYAAIKG